MPKKGFFVPSKGLFVPLQKRRRFNYLIYVCKVGKERVTLLPLLFFIVTIIMLILIFIMLMVTPELGVIFEK